MTNKLLLLAASMLAACAGVSDLGYPPGGTHHPTQVQAPVSRKASYCHEHTCKVTVTVDASCNVTVEPYALVIGGGSPPFTIEWTLEGDASFAKGGIWFKEAEGREVFRMLQGGARAFVFQNRGDRGIYHYSVQVEQGGRACPVLDPTDVNDI